MGSHDVARLQMPAEPLAVHGRTGRADLADVQHGLIVLGGADGDGVVEGRAEPPDGLAQTGRLAHLAR